MRLKKEDWELITNVKDKFNKVGQAKVNNGDDTDVDMKISKDDVKDLTKRSRVGESVLIKLAKEMESDVVKSRVDKNGITLTLNMEDYRYTDSYSIHDFDKLADEINGDDED